MLGSERGRGWISTHAGSSLGHLYSADRLLPAEEKQMEIEVLNCVAQGNQGGFRETAHGGLWVTKE